MSAGQVRKAAPAGAPAVMTSCSAFPRLPAYRPAPWLPGPHAQTVFGPLARRFPGLPLTRLRLSTPDGDEVSLDFLPPRQPSAPIVLLLHGLEGSSRSHYMGGALALLARAGWGAAALNFRGCDGRMNLTPRFYHSGETGDARFVLRWLEKHHPGHPLLAMGFSLGGNVLGRLLGEDGDASPLAAAAMLSPPFDLEESGPHLDRALGGFYGRRFLRSLKRKMVAKERIFPGCVEIIRVLRARSLVEFDDVATAPLHGFSGVEEYYRTCGCARLLPAIRRPTLVVVSGDDPLLPRHAIPVATLRENRCIHAVVTRGGGHLGFVAGPHPRAASWWAECAAVRWLGLLGAWPGCLPFFENS